MRSDPGMFVSILHVAFNLCSLRHYFPVCPDMHHIEQMYYNNERYTVSLLSCSVPRSTQAPSFIIIAERA